jgi:hypothetical protein
VAAKKIITEKELGGGIVNFGWGLLLLGGLAHMMPTQMLPLLTWSLWGISVQMAIGALSVVVALYFLLEE